MGTIFVKNIAAVLPQRFAAGDIMSETTADFINEIHSRRTLAKLRYLLDRGDISSDEIQRKAIELQSLDLSPGRTFDDEDEVVDPILDEAMVMARELIVTRMAEQGLPPPKGLDTHAKALVEGSPQLQEQARLRLEAKLTAANTALGL